MFEEWTLDRLYNELEEIRARYTDKKYPEVYYDLLEEIETREI